RHLAEPALHRAIAHQLGITADIDCARRVLRQGGEVGRSARLVLVFAALDRIGDGDDVRRLIVLHHLDDVAPDATVVVPVEVFAGDEVADLVEGLAIQEQRAEQRLLRLYRVRRDFECYELRINTRFERDALYGHFFGLPPRPE